MNKLYNKKSKNTPRIILIACIILTWFLLILYLLGKPELRSMPDNAILYTVYFDSDSDVIGHAILTESGEYTLYTANVDYHFDSGIIGDKLLTLRLNKEQLETIKESISNAYIEDSVNKDKPDNATEYIYSESEDTLISFMSRTTYIIDDKFNGEISIKNIDEESGRNIIEAIGSLDYLSLDVDMLQTSIVAYELKNKADLYRYIISKECIRWI